MSQVHPSTNVNMNVRLTRDGEGWRYGDRFVIRPVTMGSGANNNRGWSPGRREWEVIDTERESFRTAQGTYRDRTLRTRLYEVRDLITYVLKAESSAQ